MEEIIFPGSEADDRQEKTQDKHKIHSIAKQESMHHSEVLITK